MVKGIFYSLMLLGSSPAIVAATTGDYGLPEKIREGNILHCFDWTCSQVKEELPAIAEAGFGAVQLSPVQGNCNSGAEWFYAYMPYDFAFRSSGVAATKTELKSLCDEAAKYGIKIVVDVVANHVNKASGYHDKWWDSDDRVRWQGGINYNSRYSITHGQLGDYGDVNSEREDVQQRAKAFVEELKACGVAGIRWDAAKHIGLPSEGCGFWSAVTSVPDMWHYGEILDGPGGDKYNLLKEYTDYISVTDSEYSSWTYNQVCSGNVPSGHGSWTANGVPSTGIVYWGESHDTYSNDGDYGTNSSNVAQDKIDRMWAIGACRNGETSLYFSRPSATKRNNIRMGQKGSTHFTSREIAAVNHFKNAMTGRPDYYTSSDGIACVTRKDGGACIVVGAGGSRDVAVTNGGGYVPSGTYVDEVSGSTFTVTPTTISGRVGDTGIAVIYDADLPFEPGDDDDPTPADMPDEFYIIGEVNGNAWDPAIGVKMEKSGAEFVAEVNVKGYFSFTKALGKAGDWNAFNNSGNRYGATKDTKLYNGTPSPIYQMSDPSAYTVSAPGSYTITVNWSDKTVVAKEVAGINEVTITDDSAVEYYNLQGVKVENPSGGIYIIRRGNNVTKCIIP